VLFSRFSSRLILICKLGKTLLAMGFQRETASRGTLAMYTSVCFPRFHGITTRTASVSDRVCCCVRVHYIRDNTYSTFDRRRDHNHQLGHLYFRNAISLVHLNLARAHAASGDKKGCFPANHRSQCRAADRWRRRSGGAITFSLTWCFLLWTTNIG